MKPKSVFFALLFVHSFLCFSQKIKYKELYPILAEKRYEVAIPELITYMKDKDHQLEANPNLQMGLWLQERFMKMGDSDIDRLAQVGDSAVFFFSKAKDLIDDKEVKKSKDYYQDFVRRDLRSGKFLIKVSDVHLDIENRINLIKGRMKSR